MYLSSPRSNSGGRYHSVITLLVYGRLDDRTKDKIVCVLVLSHTHTHNSENNCEDCEQVWYIYISVKTIGDSPLFRVIEPGKTKVCKLYLTSDKEEKN